MTKIPSLENQVSVMFERQLKNWPLVADHYRKLQFIRKRALNLEGHRILIQFNPARIASSTARIDRNALAQRPCFLCKENRPPEQEIIPFGDDFEILINPYPIFPRHLTIASRRHQDQRISGSFRHMPDLARQLPSFVIFYNGPLCGASAPDHFHFQAGSRGFLPIEGEYRERSRIRKETEGLVIRELDDRVYRMLILESADPDLLVAEFGRLLQAQPLYPGEDEPRMNLFCFYEGDRYILFFIPREKHRPTCYGPDPKTQFMISPGCVDMGGVIITPRQEDFERLTADILFRIFRETGSNGVL